MTSLSQDGNMNILINEIRSSYRRHFKALQCDNEARLIRVLTQIYLSDPNNNSLEDKTKQRLSCSNSSFSSNNSEAAEIIKQNSLREECMRDAIRQHITALVDILPFKSSEIPDRIIEEGISTPTESEILRKLRTTEDQVSGLVSMVITKDFTAMDKFLAIVAVHNSDVVDRIRHIFNAMIEVPIGAAMPCVVCDLKEKCDIKTVYNHFFERGQISSGLHRRIVHSELPVGSQDMLWNDMLNEFGNKQDCCVILVLIEAMEHDECCNTNLFQMLKRLLRKNEPLKCSCNTHVKVIPLSNTIPTSKNSHLSQVHETELQHAPVAVSLETIPKTYVLNEEHIDLNKQEDMCMPNATLKRTCSPDAMLSTNGSVCDNTDLTTNNTTVDTSKELVDPRTIYKRSKPNDYVKDFSCDQSSTTNGTDKQTDEIRDIHDTGHPEESDETFVKLADSHSLEENTKFTRKKYNLKKLRQKSESENTNTEYTHKSNCYSGRK